MDLQHDNPMIKQKAAGSNAGPRLDVSKMNQTKTGPRWETWTPAAGKPAGRAPSYAAWKSVIGRSFLDGL
jgi:hypothetical protein